MKNTIEIRLTKANNESVSLKSMSAEALESFLVVISSLKSIAESVVEKSELTFSVIEGSALYRVEAPIAGTEAIYKAIDSTIKGESRDKDLVKQVRKIQEQIQHDGFNYGFFYQKKEKSIELHERLVQAKKVAVKRVRNRSFDYELRLIPGIIYQIGGTQPNYHLDLGNKTKLTIDCSKEEAILVNPFLYKKVNCLVHVKNWQNAEKKVEYFHRSVVDDQLADRMKVFLDSYQKETDLVEQLSLIYDFLDRMFESTDLGLIALRTLMTTFNDLKFHLSEIKTLLVISKPFSDHPKIKNGRLSLLETWQAKRK